MAEKYSSPLGFDDILPEDISGWQQLEACTRDVFRKYCYHEMRTPIMESTDLFTRSIGETTDIVEKEMYTFGSDTDSSLTMRPEGTASVVRAYVQHQYQKRAPFQKFYYIGPMFRKERPQRGRTRQFHQIGAEVIGSADPLMDVESMALAMEIFQTFGIKGAALQINSIGCPECRKEMRRGLLEYFNPRKAELCGDCEKRLERNVFRVLDCKKEPCRNAAAGSPVITEFLCSDCGVHYEAVKQGLTECGVQYKENRYLARGFDYYTRTIFEIIGKNLGAQNALGGGGRYNGLVGELGGSDAPCVGFGLGMERILLSAEADTLKPQRMDAYIVTVSKEQKPVSFSLLNNLRSRGIAADMDYESRSFKAQMRMANREGARFAVIIGEDEVRDKQASVKDMERKDQNTVAFEELYNYINAGCSDKQRCEK